jgi:hypothetical protein
MRSVARLYGRGGASGEKRRQIARQLLLRLLVAAALVLLAQAVAPSAQEQLEDMTLPDTPLPVLLTGVALLGPLAAGEALATWAGPPAGPLLRALPMLVAWGLIAATFPLMRRLFLWRWQPLGGQTLKEIVFWLPPLPLDREQCRASDLRAIGVVIVVMAWVGGTYALINVLSRRVAEDLQVGNIVWQVESLADAVRSTMMWALPVGIGWPALLLLALAFLWVLLWPLSALALVLWYLVVIPVARRRWWQEQLRRGEQGVSLSQGQAEAWLRMRRRWPRLLLAWWYGGGEAIRALDRAAREVLQGRGTWQPGSPGVSAARWE